MYLYDFSRFVSICLYRSDRLPKYVGKLIVDGQSLNTYYSRTVSFFLKKII